MCFARDRIKVFSGAMFDHRVHLFRQVHLLNHTPFVQWLKACCVFGVKLIFEDFVDLLGLKRGASAFMMAKLSAALALPAI